MTALPNNRPETIAAEIKKAFHTIVAHDMTRRDAQSVARDASQAATGARESALITLAGIADRDKWSRFEMDEAITKALASRNVKDTTLSSFASEIKRACHPNVRKHVSALAKLAGDVWDAEGAAERKIGRPCRKAFQRRYHMLQRMLGEALDARVFKTATEVIRWAVVNDPDLDYAKVFKRIKAIRQQLRDFAADFPVDGLSTCDAFLGSITIGELEDCRKASDKPADAPAPANDPQSSAEPAQGASDLLDDALADMTGDAPALKAA